MKTQSSWDCAVWSLTMNTCGWHTLGDMKTQDLGWYLDFNYSASAKSYIDHVHHFSSRIQAKMLTNSPEAVLGIRNITYQKRHLLWTSILFGRLFRQKSTSYGSSGRSVWSKMLSRWSCFFDDIVLSKTAVLKAKRITLPQDFDVNPSCCWKKTCSSWGCVALFLEEHTTLCDGIDIVAKLHSTHYLHPPIGLKALFALNNPANPLFALTNFVNHTQNTIPTIHTDWNKLFL